MQSRRGKAWWWVAVAPLVLPALVASCSTPSEDVDAGDLLGVFSNDGGTDGSIDAAAPDGGKRLRKHGTDGGAEPSSAADAAVRAPVAGSCVAAQGEADNEVKKNLGRPACRDAQVLEWTDSVGEPRYACVFAPRGMEGLAPLPVVLFFHGALDTPTMVDKQTSLRKLLTSTDLSGDPAHKGFVVVAVQGRTISGGRRGNAFDTGFSGEANVDAAATDHFLGEIEKKGWVDRRRIYAIGSSSGGQMAALYAMMRPDRVAAFGTFAAEPIAPKWACGGPPPPAAVLYRACDFFASCESVEGWLHARDAEGAETSWQRLGAGNEEEPTCLLRKKCSEPKGTANHRRWPKGKEDVFLRFFAQHALGAGAAEAPDGGPR